MHKLQYFFLIRAYTSICRINQVKEDAMKCYTNSLNDHPVNLEKVRGCLGKQIL